MHYPVLDDLCFLGVFFASLMLFPAPTPFDGLFRALCRNQLSLHETPIPTLGTEQLFLFTFFFSVP